MAIKRKTTSQHQRTKGLDFRCPKDDAWYGVRLLKVKEGVLRVMYLDFHEADDEWFSSDQFESVAEIEELAGRFRRPAEQLQDSECGGVRKGMVVLACGTFPRDEVMFYDATVDAVTRSAHEYNGPSEEQVCTCKFHVTWKHGPAAKKQATVRTENICLILDSPVDDPVLDEFIASARKSLEDFMRNTANQDGNFGLNAGDSSCAAPQHPAKVPVLVDLESPDSSHNEKTGQSYEDTKPLNKSKGDGSTELPSKGLANGQKETYFFWVDNLDEDVKPHKIVNFLKREFSVSSQVALYPDMFLDNTCSGAIYVESKVHARQLVKLLRNPDSIIVSLKGRPWVFNEKCCGILHSPMPWQEMNLDPENQDDKTDIRLLHPGSEGYEQTRRILDLCRAHCEHVERLKQNLRSEELKLRNALPNGSQSRPSTSKRNSHFFCMV